MTKKEALQALYRLLLELYDNEDRATMLADQSGVPVAMVGGRGTIATYWWNLIVAAHQRNSVQKLVMNASWDFPERGAELKQAFSAYDSATDSGADIEPMGKEGAGSRVIDTGGGAYIGGGVTIGGDFVGRDQMVYGDRITVGDVSDAKGVAIGRGARASVQTGVSGAELAALFQTVNARITQRPEDPAVGKDELRSLVDRVKDEVAKGQGANLNWLERWLKNLIEVAPDVAEVALAALANPVAGVATAVAKLATRLKAGLA